MGEDSITLREHGVLDCKVRVAWRAAAAAGIAFARPRAGLDGALQRIIDALLGSGRWGVLTLSTRGL